MAGRSKNVLINGAAGETPPLAVDAENVDTATYPTWGYKTDDARIFVLAEGEKLPPEWSYTPVVAPLTDKGPE